MKKFQPLFLLLLLARIACAALSAPATPTKAPFPYVWATAHHILPQTTSDEAGYFSIIQGHNGRIYIGTAKDDADAYLVEFDPQTNQQRIVIDTNKVNDLTATGYAAQAKIHTRNFVGASGKIYCGSQEGYRDIPGDKSVYQGGFVMTYDPTTEKAESLGMPMKGEGIIDVVADEARNSLYVVTTLGEDKVAHWLVGNIKTKSYHELGPLPTDYASTLLDNKGRANVMTADSRIATYDPQTGKIAVRDIMLNGKKWVRNNDSAVPTWQLTPDKNGAYLVLMNEATLFHLDLRGNGSVKAKVLCQLIGGKGFDSRSSLTVAPDGRVYALIKTDNETGFGNFPLQHLTRYDPTTERAVDLGVLAVKNPTFYDFSPDKQRPNAAPYTYHGYDKLPDGTLAPTTVNQGLVAAKDGTMYALILYPYTLLKMESAAPAGEGFEPQRTNVLDHAQIPVLNSKGLAAALVTPKLASPSQQYIDFSLRSCDNVEKNLPQITRIAEIVADRHIKGGLLGFPWNSQSLQQEIAGRAGGLMNIDFDRPWANRNAADDKYNVAIIGWDRAPAADEVAKLQKLKDAGTFILGFGPKDLPSLAEEVKVCDAFIDTGLGADDRVVTLPNGEKAGQGNELVNMLNGWAFTGEFIAALTRKGKMPPIWKAFMYPDGKDWMNKYFGKIQFHDPKEFPVPPIAPGVITRDFLNKIRANISWFQSTQNVRVNEAAYLIANDLNVERKTIVSAMGHAPWTFVGKYEDARWCDPYELDSGDSVHIENYKKTPVGALVLRLGYGGLDDKAAAIYAAKDQRVIMVSSPDPRPDSQSKVGVILDIDMGWKYGDALVSIPNYPIKLIPPSGIMQVVAYECINTEVLARLPKSTP